MSRYDRDMRNEGIDRARAAIQPMRKEVTAHPIHEQIDDRADMAVFMEPTFSRCGTSCRSSSPFSAI